jgi:serine/threonine protein kinase
VQEGTQLEHYRIIDKLGEGGMGVVYRADDTKLRREVAIKVLPEVVANDPDRLARFEREAHLLAALNHGGIASIYGLEQAEGMRFLVMELVPGENLEQHLSAGRLEVRRALEIGKHVAEALEEAHSKGIIHRDLKPANVMATPDGKVKVLDLGLAKALIGDAGAGSSADVSMSPTVAVAGTAAGVILGTAAYMSPEQARGSTLDARTDIWSYGCLLYECLTSRKAFTGATVSDLTAAILKEEPDWTAVPAEVPASVRQLLQRCLQKDARRRLQAIGDARIELEDALRQVDNLADGTLASGISPASGSIAGAGFDATAPTWSFPRSTPPLKAGACIAGTWRREACRPSRARKTRTSLSSPRTRSGYWCGQTAARWTVCRLPAVGERW